MHSRPFLFPATLIALALAAALGSCGGTGDPRGTRPDIVLVVVDTLRADHLGIYGHERATSPTIDRLAREGVWFRRAFSHSGWTLTSFGSLLTGQLPHEHRMGRNPLPRSQKEIEFGALAESATTLAEHLTQYGYRCKAIVNNTFLSPEFRLDQGFDEGYDYRPATNNDIRSAEDSVDLAIEWLKTENSEPAFLLLHFMEPHLAYGSEHQSGHFTDFADAGRGKPPVELPFASREVVSELMKGRARLDEVELDYVKRLYDEEILTVDRALSRFVEFLERRSRAEQTVVVVTADHGEEFFDHGRFEHGHTLYSELTRVPLVVWGAGITGGEQTALVQHIDLFHGLLSLGGAGAERGATAEDLFEILFHPEKYGERFVLAENCLYGTQKTAIIDGRHSLHFDMTKKRFEVFALDDRGVEQERLGEAEARAVLKRLQPELTRLRGGSLKPVEIMPDAGLDVETLRHLQSLGYVGK